MFFFVVVLEVPPFFCDIGFRVFKKMGGGRKKERDSRGKTFRRQRTKGVFEYEILSRFFPHIELY